jgi:hypothetical protein
MLRRAFDVFDGRAGLGDRGGPVKILVALVNIRYGFGVMAEKNETDISIAARVDRPLYEKILRRQREVRQLTGIEPSLSAVVRALLTEAPASVKGRGIRGRAAA